MSRKAFACGFTLIELLVVIAILGLLAAVLFPVFAKVRENGRRAVCLSNEHQLGLAMQMYAHDSDDTLPSGSHRGGTTTVALPQDGPGGTGMGWAGEVYPYVDCTPEVRQMVKVVYSEGETTEHEHQAPHLHQRVQAASPARSPGGQAHRPGRP